MPELTKEDRISMYQSMVVQIHTIVNEINQEHELIAKRIPDTPAMGDPRSCGENADEYTNFYHRILRHYYVLINAGRYVGILISTTDEDFVEICGGNTDEFDEYLASMLQNNLDKRKEVKKWMATLCIEDGGVPSGHNQCSDKEDGDDGDQ